MILIIPFKNLTTEQMGFFDIPCALFHFEHVMNLPFTDITKNEKTKFEKI